jgi:hypothetical protein
MILRLSRTRVRRTGEEAVVAALRSWLNSHESRPDGLLDLVFGRRFTDDGRVEHVTASLWKDQPTMVRGLGPDYDQPTALINAAADEIEDHRIEHFDVFADDWPELVAYIGPDPSQDPGRRFH